MKCWCTLAPPMKMRPWEPPLPLQSPLLLVPLAGLPASGTSNTQRAGWGQRSGPGPGAGLILVCSSEQLVTEEPAGQGGDWEDRSQVTSL